MVKRLKKIIKNNKITIMPCCYDVISAKLIEQAGFDLSFMSGFGVSASKIGMPDTGLDESAVEAIQKTKFEPARQRELPVGVWITIPVNFTLRK